MLPLEQTPLTLQDLRALAQAHSTDDAVSLLESYARNYSGNLRKRLFFRFRQDITNSVNNVKSIRGVLDGVLEDRLWYIDHTTATTDYEELYWMDLRIDPSNPLQWIYFPSEEAAHSGKRRSGKPARVLKKFEEIIYKMLCKFYSKSDLGSYDTFIGEIGNAWATQNEPPEVIRASGEEEIVYVYTNGPRSCMSHPAEHFSYTEKHPTAAFDSPDLTLLYAKKNGRIVARTILNEVKKCYARIYGNVKSLEPWLKKEGYSCRSDFSGCRIKKIEVLFGTPHYVMPYLDATPYLDEFDDEYFIIVGDLERSKYRAHSTSGIIEKIIPPICICCGELFSGSERKTREGDRLCEPCSEEKYIRAVVLLPDREPVYRWILRGSNTVYRYNTHEATEEAILGYWKDHKSILKTLEVLCPATTEVEEHG